MPCVSGENFKPTKVPDPPDAEFELPVAGLTGRRRFLPPIDSPAYHVMLAVVALFILGPLGGISAAFMNFSIGFFVGGQVLAGILGSTVTLPYGPEGRHGANYLQTMAASVAGMCGMAVLLQAMVWLGLPEPPVWKLVLYFMCLGMFGVGVGMLYTPILVDRMRLTYPSGYAVANILRALTDKNLLRRSIAKLGGGAFSGYGLGIFSLKTASLGLSKGTVAWFEGLNISASTFGAGMICGARITIPALVVGAHRHLATPYLVQHRLAEARRALPQDRFHHRPGHHSRRRHPRHDLDPHPAVRRFRAQHEPPEQPAEDWKRVNVCRPGVVGRLLGRCDRRRSAARSCTSRSSFSSSRWASAFCSCWSTASRSVSRTGTRSPAPSC